MMTAERRYFFDFRTDDMVISDEEGMLFAHIDDARAEASASLDDLAREVLKAGHGWSRISVEVRDDTGLLFVVNFTYQ